MTIWLVASSLVMFIAPLLDKLAGERLSERVLTVLDMLIAVLVIAHILPECFEALGWTAILLCALGAAIPSMIEQFFARSVPQVHLVSRVLVVGGLIIHNYMDGAMIVSILHVPMAMDTNALIFLVVHKIPVALAVWRNTSKKLAWGVLTLLGVSNMCGYLLQFNFVNAIPVAWHYGLLAFMAGSFLHLCVHRLQR